MIEENLKHPIINILYIEERKQDAETLASKYISLGAIVRLIEVADDKHSKAHRGKLFYFNKLTRFAEIANALAKSVQKIEEVSPQYIKNEQNQQANYAIWIVRKVKFHGQKNEKKSDKNNQLLRVKQALIKSTIPVKAPVKIKETKESNLVPCPQCQSFVSNKRLEKHLLKIHHTAILQQFSPQLPSPIIIKKLKKKVLIKNFSFSKNHAPVLRDNLFKFQSSAKSSPTPKKIYCRHCNRPKINDTDVCYTCHSK